MANITVNTTSTNFGLLPADLSQFPGWLGQYLPAGQTISQDQSNVVSDFVSMTNALNAYIAGNGVSAFNYLSTTEAQVTEGNFSVDMHGFFSGFYSELTQLSITNTTTGETVTEYGGLTYFGFPLLAQPSTGSTLSAISDTIPSAVAPSVAQIGVVPMNVIWNGTTWNGTATGFTDIISDPANNKAYQLALTENPATFAFGPAAGSYSLAAPTVTGVGLTVEDNAAVNTFDTLQINGASFAANAVSAAQSIATALAGSDTLSISGAGSLNVAGALVNASNTITGLTISDTAANVVANLDYLQTLAAQGKLSAIALTDAGSPVLTITTGQQAADATALAEITSPHSVVVLPPSGAGVLGGLSAAQQLEMIYIAYFNRSADGAGDTFWVGQNVQAQARGQSAAAALSNIANSFTPQAETIALYPFLGTPNLNLSTPAAQAGLTSFIGSVYANMFGHAPDSAGQTYWVAQITSGAVGLGAAALAIANGATGADAIEINNKIAVATDFTTRTIGAGLGESAPQPASFVTAARNVLSGVDGAALGDASVTTGMKATTAFIASSGISQQTASGSTDATIITVSGAGQLIDPGAGSHTIQFLAGATADTLVLRADAVDQVAGFNPAVDSLDVASLLSAANIDLNGDVAALGNYLTIANQGSDAVVDFDPSGHGGGTTIAVLQGLAGTGLDTLLAKGAIRLA